MKTQAPRTFHDRITHDLPSRAAAWSESWWFFREHWLKGLGRRDQPLPALPQGPVPPACRHTNQITWVGHASFVVQAGGKTVLVDPVWSDRLPGGIRRLAPPGLAWDLLPSIDAVLLTHNHFDHMDAPTLLRLPRATLIVVPLGLGRWFTRRGFTRVVELDWWQGHEEDGLRCELVPAHHWSRRGILDLNRSLWGGWVIQVRGGPKTYISGDTAYGPFFSEIGRRHPDLAVAALPIGAYAPRAVNRTVHTDPEEALQAFRDLGARTMVPMHWATFRLGQEPVLEPIERLLSAWQAAGLPHERLWDLAIGQTQAIGAAHCLCPQDRPARPARRVQFILEKPSPKVGPVSSA